MNLYGKVAQLLKVQSKNSYVSTLFLLWILGPIGIILVGKTNSVILPCPYQYLYSSLFDVYLLSSIVAFNVAKPIP